MPDSIIASITSPEQGAQQECNNSFLPLSGSSSFSRISVIMFFLVFCSAKKVIFSILRKIIYAFVSFIFFALSSIKVRAASYSLGIFPSKIASFMASFKIPISLEGFKLKVSIISSPEIGG